MAVAPPLSASETDWINLTRLLARLDHKLSAPLPLALSSVDRAKLAANLEYARQLLQKLESQSSAITAPAKRQKTLAELGTKRQVIRRLNEGLHHVATEAEEEEEEEEEEEDGDNGEDEDEGVGVRGAEEDNDDYGRLRASTRPSPRPVTTTALPEPADEGMRNRAPKPAEPQAPRTEAQMQAELFARKTKEVAGTEQLLDEQHHEQEVLTSSLLDMAKMLKESSRQFGRSLEDEKTFLDQAASGLDRNTTGMQTAGKRIEDLRKNETVGLYWTAIYLASIVGLAFLTLFVLFFAPKLRW